MSPDDPLPAAQPPVPGQKNWLGVLALILGIIGVAASWLVRLMPYVQVAAVLAIILGAIGIKSAKRGAASNLAVARWGMWLGIAGLVLTVLVILAAMALLAAIN